MNAPTLAEVQMRRAEIYALADQYGVTNLRVFGSTARGEARPDSDIDLLVDLPPRFGLVQWSGLVRRLEALLNRRVELVSASHLRPELREIILREARPL